MLIGINMLQAAIMASSTPQTVLWLRDRMTEEGEEEDFEIRKIAEQAAGKLGTRVFVFLCFSLSVLFACLLAFCIFVTCALCFMLCILDLVLHVLCSVF